jgi:hypothetical protein
MRRVFVLVMLFMLTASGLMAQEETPEPEPDRCPAIVQSAIDLTQRNCDGIGDNEVCYGHIVLEAEAQPGIREFEFSMPGDVVRAVNLSSLRLSAMDTLTGQWGIVAMAILAQAQAVTIQEETQVILFGDVELNDATTFVEVSTAVRVNIRQIPALDGEIVRALLPDETVVANGRLEDGSWVRVLLDDVDNRLGWLAAESLTFDGDFDALTVIPDEAALSGTPDELAIYGPMQAFYFQSGTNDSPCAQAPNSGILIQTPEGVGSLSIWMDEAVIQMDDTVFLQAEPGGNLSVNVIAGSAQVQAMGETSTALAGMAVDVPLTESLGAADEPGDPRPFDADDVSALPVNLLDDETTVPEPAIIEPGVPLEGQWAFAWAVPELTCPDGTAVPFTSTDNASVLQVQAEAIVWGATTYSQSTVGVYEATYADGNGNLHQDTLQVVAPDFIQGEKVLDLVQPVCTLTVAFSLSLVSG